MPGTENMIISSLSPFGYVVNDRVTPDTDQSKKSFLAFEYIIFSARIFASASEK